MAKWKPGDLRLHMRVVSADGEQVGHVGKIYADSFLVHKGYLFPIDRYLPYRVIARLEENEIHLALSSSQIEDVLWQKRPDYEHHLGDPLQIFYDEGHGVNNPYDKHNPTN